MRPIDGQMAQLFITTARRFAAGQYKMKHAARRNRLRGQFGNTLRDCGAQPFRVIMHKNGLRVGQIGDVHYPKPDKPEPKKMAVFVGRKSGAPSDTSMSDNAALIRPTTAQFLSRFDMI